MFQMKIQPGVVPLVASSYIILSQCNLSRSDSSTKCIVFGLLAQSLCYESRGTGSRDGDKTTAK